MGVIDAGYDSSAFAGMAHDLSLQNKAEVVRETLKRPIVSTSPGDNVLSDVIKEANILLTMTKASLNISSPFQFSDRLEVFKKCMDVYGYPIKTKRLSMLNNLRDQLTANQSHYLDITGQIAYIAHLNIGRGSWGPSMEATRRNIEAYKKVLTDVSSVQLPKFLDQLLSSGGQEMQRRMLKTLTAKELNKISSKKLIETMTKVYLTPPSEAEGEESREEILAAVEKIAGDASRYEQWVEEQREIIRELAVIIVKVSMRSKRKVVNGEGEKRDEHPVLKCQALWYELHVAIEEQRWSLTAISMLEKVIRSLMGGPAEVPNDLALCGKAVELIERSVREKRVWSGEGQKKFIAKMELLRRWTEEVRGTFVTAEVEAVDFADGLPVSMQNPDLLLAVRYLVQEAGRLVETRLHMKECVELVRDIKGRKKAVGGSVVVAMNRALAIADVIEKLSRTSTKGLVEHAVSFHSDQDGFADSPKGNQMVVATEKLSAHVDAVRALMLDFYGLTSSLDPALELPCKIPGNFFLIDEIDRQVRDVMEAAEDMEKYVEIKASVMADLAVGSDEFVASGVNGEVADEVKEAQEKFLRMKGDVERVLNAFADVELSLPLIAELRNLIDNIGESDDPRDHETILAEYFELRPAIQRALLFAASFESIVLLSREFNEAASKVRAMAWTKEPEVQEEFMGASLTHMKTRTSSGTPYSPVLATIEEKDESTNSGGAVTSGVPRMVSRDVAEKTEGARLTQSQPKTGKSMGYLTTSSGRDTADSGKECAVASKTQSTEESTIGKHDALRLEEAKSIDGAAASLNTRSSSVTTTASSKVTPTVRLASGHHPLGGICLIVIMATTLMS
ncbi:chloroquine resistance marker protein [Babesia caballi]|uniref:Chloroquine resistance marker protein n=1 Tax=Babesia caballi TaxID=5871 RepID=A0AAV4LQ72_BABCB|nr:chloroquine resistance marker protein [Babesia caballi]